MKTQSRRRLSQWRKLILVDLFLLFALGCSTVTLQHPIGAPAGERTAAGERLDAILDGVWVSEQQLQNIRDAEATLADPALDEAHRKRISETEGFGKTSEAFLMRYLGDGRASMAFPEAAGDQLRLQNDELLICEVDGELYAHMAAGGPEPPPADADDAADDATEPEVVGRYIVVLLRPEKNAFRVYCPSVESVAAAVNKGELSGHVNWDLDDDEPRAESVVLTGDSEQLAKVFTAARVEEFFALDEPVEIYRRVVPLAYPPQDDPRPVADE